MSRPVPSDWVNPSMPCPAATSSPSLPAGRPICTALRLLLNERRLLALPRNQRLAALLADSRKYQNEVSERLAVQVLHALYELLRGFQAAHDASRDDLLNDQLREDPGGIYRGLLTVVLRLVFLLFAEERDLLSDDETFVRHYSLASLHDRLRADAALHPDTMDLLDRRLLERSCLFMGEHRSCAQGPARSLVAEPKTKRELIHVASLTKRLPRPAVAPGRLKDEVPSPQQLRSERVRRDLVQVRVGSGIRPLDVHCRRRVDVGLMVEQDVTKFVSECESLYREVTPSCHEDPGCAIGCANIGTEQPIERPKKERDAA